MFHSVIASKAKVELNQGKNDVGIIHNIKPSVDATNFCCTKVNPESNDYSGDVDPSESLL